MYLLYIVQDDIMYKTTNSLPDPDWQEDDYCHQKNLVNTSSSTARFLSY